MQISWRDRIVGAEILRYRISMYNPGRCKSPACYRACSQSYHVHLTVTASASRTQ